MAARRATPPSNNVRSPLEPAELVENGLKLLESRMASDPVRRRRSVVARGPCRLSAPADCNFFTSRSSGVPEPARRCGPRCGRPFILIGPHPDASVRQSPIFSRTHAYPWNIASSYLNLERHRTLLHGCASPWPAMPTRLTEAHALGDGGQGGLVAVDGVGEGLQRVQGGLALVGARATAEEACASRAQRHHGTCGGGRNRHRLM